MFDLEAFLEQVALEEVEHVLNGGVKGEFACHVVVEVSEVAEIAHGFADAMNAGQGTIGNRAEMGRQGVDVDFPFLFVDLGGEGGIGLERADFFPFAIGGQKSDGAGNMSRRRTVRESPTSEIGALISLATPIASWPMLANFSFWTSEACASRSWRFWTASVFWKVEDTLGGRAGADAKLIAVEGLCEEVIGAAVHSLDEVFVLGFGGEENQVDVIEEVLGADSADELDAVHFGHHPVGDDDREFSFVETFEGFRTGDGFGDLVAEFFERAAKQAARDGVIFCNQDFHGGSPRNH